MATGQVSAGDSDLLRCGAGAEPLDVRHRLRGRREVIVPLLYNDHTAQTPRSTRLLTTLKIGYALVFDPHPSDVHVPLHHLPVEVRRALDRVQKEVVEVDSRLNRDDVAWFELAAETEVPDLGVGGAAVGETGDVVGL